MLEAQPHEMVKGVYWLTNDQKQLATVNLVPGFNSCNEDLITVGSIEYRIWSPYHSKAASALWKGVRRFPISRGMKLLYLGIASGTTASYLSDIIGHSGTIYGIELSERPMRELIPVAEKRGNIIPILADARFPDRYSILVETVDVIYCDIAQPDQANVLADNAELYLKSGGDVLFAIKARSIDVARAPDAIFREEVETLKGRGFTVQEVLKLEPYQNDHAMAVAAYRRK